MPLLNIIKLVNDFLPVIVEMERNGTKIDLEELERLESYFRGELANITKAVDTYIKVVWGDKPLNKGSPTDISKLIFSREITDKAYWVENIVENKYRRTWGKNRLQDELNKCTKYVYRYRAEQCGECDGTGRIFPDKKDGTPGKRYLLCKNCDGTGIVYQPIRNMDGRRVVAGLRKIPDKYDGVSTLGFQVTPITLDKVYKGTKHGHIRAFVKRLGELNSITHNLDTHLKGIKTFVGDDGILHTSLHQHVTRTGRLSSTKPNKHNQPRGSDFPIRKLFVSRFKGGKILEGDYSTLEFSVAADMSGCEKAIQAVKDKIDAHTITANTLTEAGQETNRQEAKAHTFKPLYGGTSGTKPERTYYKAFLDEMYPGINEWHNSLIAQAVRDKVIVLPSGREYAFPDVKLFPNGGVLHGTKIKNYPVQGFATADIVPTAGIELYKRLWDYRSLLILTVHDNWMIDVHPDEVTIMPRLLRDTMLEVPDFVFKRFGYRLKVPIRVEIKMGDNWLEAKEVEFDDV